MAPSASKIVIGYWNIRALLAPIQYLLQVSGLEHEIKLYEFEKESTVFAEYAASWLREKSKMGLDFANLPYLIDGEVRLTQSLAIMRYIARKAGLYGVAADASPAEMAKLDLIEQQVNDLWWSYIRYGVGNPLIAVRCPEGFSASLVGQLEPIAAWLKNKHFVMGDNVCYVDFILFEVLDVFKMINPDCLATYPGLTAYVERIQNIPAMKKYLASSECLRWPVLSPPAQIWGWKKTD